MSTKQQNAEFIDRCSVMVDMFEEIIVAHESATGPILGDVYMAGKGLMDLYQRAAEILPVPEEDVSHD